MIAGSRLRVGVLALALLLAGCTLGGGPGGPLAPAAEEPTATPGPNSTEQTPAARSVTLENHSLSLDAANVFSRVEGLVGEDVQEPPVRVIVNESSGPVSPGFTHTPYRFAQYLDLDNVSAGGPSAAGLTDGLGRVYIIPGSGPRSVLTQVLVHEFVHVVQFRSGMLPWASPAAGNDTTDAAMVRLALTEGPAVYVTDEYTEEYLAGANVTSQSAQMARLYADSYPGGRFRAAPYYFGSQYVHHRLDDPSELRSLYDDLPATTEQLLHNDSAPGDPYQPLVVDASGGGGWVVSDPEDVDIMGELFVRIALSRSLNRSTAAEAAAGWGVDRVITYEQGDTAGFAWVLRWDDPANATEFGAAMDTYINRRPTGADLSLRTEAVGEETVAVFLGPPGFVDAATATGTSDDVLVTVTG
jgi:hypothetical protein